MTPPATAVVEKIEDLLAMATPGPWAHHRWSLSDSDDTIIIRVAGHLAIRVNDLELIALLRNNIESLLAERKRLREALEDAFNITNGNMPEKWREKAKQALSPAGENGGKGHE